MKFEKTREGLLLEVQVKPRAKTFGIKVVDDELVVSCTQPPIDGKANRELTKNLSRIFGRVKLVSGFRANTKKVLLKDISSNEILRILDGARKGRRD